MAAWMAAWVAVWVARAGDGARRAAGSGARRTTGTAAGHKACSDRGARLPAGPRPMSQAALESKRNTRALVLLMVVVLAWGTMWPVNKALLAYVTPIWS